MDRATGHLGDPGRRDQRGAALEQGDRFPIVADREPVAVGSDEAGPGLVRGRLRWPGSVHRPSPSSRRTLATLSTASKSASAWTVSDSAASVAVCVTTTMRA